MGDIADWMEETMPQSIEECAEQPEPHLLYLAPAGAEILLKALQSISKNTCCDRCQEAALVARKALSDAGF